MTLRLMLMGVVLVLFGFETAQAELDRYGFCKCRTKLDSRIVRFCSQIHKYSFHNETNFDAACESKATSGALDWFDSCRWRSSVSEAGANNMMEDCIEKNIEDLNVRGKVDKPRKQFKNPNKVN